MNLKVQCTLLPHANVINIMCRPAIRNSLVGSTSSLDAPTACGSRQWSLNIDKEMHGEQKNEDNGDGIEIKHMCVCVLTKFTVDQQYSVYASIIISLYLGVQHNHRSRRKDNIHKEWTLVYCSCTCRWVHMCPCGCGGSSINTTADTSMSFFKFWQLLEVL